MRTQEDWLVMILLAVSMAACQAPPTRMMSPPIDTATISIPPSTVPIAPTATRSIITTPLAIAPPGSPTTIPFFSVTITPTAATQPSETKPTLLPSRSPAGTRGMIAGTLSFPSQYIPPLTIYAIKIDQGAIIYHSIRTQPNQQTFIIGNLEPGVYNVLAYVDFNPQLIGAYSQAVICGLKATCADHSAIPITVTAGQIARGVQVSDWYAPAGTFPLPPDAPPTTPRAIRSPQPSIPSGDQTSINMAMTEAGSVAVLCQNAVFNLTTPVIFTRPNQEIYTEGFPTNSRRVTLRVVSPNLVNAVSGEGQSRIKLRNVVVDGSRQATGLISSLRRLARRLPSVGFLRTRPASERLAPVSLTSGRSTRIRTSSFTTFSTTRTVISPKTEKRTGPSDGRTVRILPFIVSLAGGETSTSARALTTCSFGRTISSITRIHSTSPRTSRPILIREIRRGLGI